MQALKEAIEAAWEKRTAPVHVDLSDSNQFKWNEVTWYSRLGAIIFCFGVIPALFFYIGIQTQQVRDIPLSIVMPQAAAPITTSHASDAAASATFADSTIESTLAACQQDPSNGTPSGPDCLGDALKKYDDIEKQKYAELLATLQSLLPEEERQAAALGDNSDQYVQAIASLKKSEAAWKTYGDSLCEAESEGYSDTWSIANSYDSCEISAAKKHIQDLLDAAPPVG